MQKRQKLNLEQQAQLRDTTRGGFQSPLKIRNGEADRIVPMDQSAPRLTFASLTVNRHAYAPLRVAPDRAISVSKTVTSNDLRAPVASTSNALSSQTPSVAHSLSPSGVVDFFQRLSTTSPTTSTKTV